MRTLTTAQRPSLLMLLLSAVVLLCSGCKGQLEGTPIENARFVSINAQGVVTHQGFTGASGSFTYSQGDTVSFYVGDALLGKAAAASKVPTAALVSQASHADALTNLMGFLQSMDSDLNALNGIQIASTAHQAASGLQLDFNAAMSTFKMQASVVKLLAVAGSSPSLPDAVQALTQFRMNLLNSYNTNSADTVLNLLNTTWNSTFSSSDCGTTTASLKHNFNIAGHVTAGHHNLALKSNGTCGASNFALMLALYENDTAFACANGCTFADLNRTVTLSFPTAHDATLIHQPGSNVITVIHHYDGRDVIETMVRK